ncbi:MAG: sulfotransferase [Flavobacteriales bacterium]|nr:sulfotransferase [Flavobacteriales bacterium]
MENITTDSPDGTRLELNKSRPLPDFVIIGAQKAASTFITHCLDSHPDIFIPRSEITYFETPEFENEPSTALTSLFIGNEDKMVGIKRPNYLSLREVPERIHATVPNARIIAILRNPVERIISAYYHYMDYGIIPVREVESGMTKVLDKEYSDQYPKAAEIIEFGLYHDPIVRYQSLFGKKNVLVLLQDDLIVDKMSVMKQLYGFLGVDTSFTPTTINSRPGAVTYNIPRLRFQSSVNALNFEYRYDGTKVFAKKKNLFEKIVTKTVARIDRYILLKLLGNKKPKISSNLNKRLHSVYRKDIDNLEALLGRDLSAWKNE